MAIIVSLEYFIRKIFFDNFVFLRKYFQITVKNIHIEILRKFYVLIVLLNDMNLLKWRMISVEDLCLWKRIVPWFIKSRFSIRWTSFYKYIDDSDNMNMIQWIFNCLYHFIKSVIKTQQKDTANEFEWIHWNGFKVMQRTDII